MGEGIAGKKVGRVMGQGKQDKIQQNLSANGKDFIASEDSSFDLKIMFCYYYSLDQNMHIVNTQKFHSRTETILINIPCSTDYRL